MGFFKNVLKSVGKVGSKVLGVTTGLQQAVGNIVGLPEVPTLGNIIQQKALEKITGYDPSQQPQTTEITQPVETKPVGVFTSMNQPEVIPVVTEQTRTIDPQQVTAALQTQTTNNNTQSSTMEKLKSFFKQHGKKIGIAAAAIVALVVIVKKLRKGKKGGW